MLRTLGIAFFLPSFFVSPSYASANQPAVFVLGTIHGLHLEKKWSYPLSALKLVIKEISPDLICGEVNPEHLPKKLEGFYPPENALIQEVADKIGAHFEPTDWRGHNPGMIEAENAMSPAERKVFDSAHDKLLKAIPYGSEKVFRFLHTDAQPLIREAHEIRIKTGTEVADGYWLARNQRIVKNCMRKAEKLNAKKVLFIYGIEHKYILEDYLKSYYALSTKDIPSIKMPKPSQVSQAVVKKWKQWQSELNAVVEGPDTQPEIKEMVLNSKRIEELQKFIDSKGSQR